MDAIYAWHQPNFYLFIPGGNDYTDSEVVCFPEVVVRRKFEMDLAAFCDALPPSASNFLSWL